MPWLFDTYVMTAADFYVACVMGGEPEMKPIRIDIRKDGGEPHIRSD